MTAAAEARPPSGCPDGPLGAGWREVTLRAQCAVLPRGRSVVSCTAERGAGGLGRHLNEIVAALERGGREAVCVSGSTRAHGTPAQRRAPRHALGLPYLSRALRTLPVPASRGVRVKAFFVEFDAYAARQLPAAEHLIAFNGQALTQFETARSERYESVVLVSANPHLRRLARQHALARRQYPFEGSWASRLLERNLAEYAQADRVYYASRYIQESFLAEGFPEERLLRFPLTPDARFERAGVRRRTSDLFEIVYVGSLAVHKGVPLLLDAFRRLPYADMRLRLVGGWGTPGMRRFIQSACADDGRIVVCPGDPLPHLDAARLCAHPAYEDGFGYAPAEALAAGVPVIVSEDTGMKELIDPGRNGLVLPTGDLGALTQAIEAAYRGEVLDG